MALVRIKLARAPLATPTRLQLRRTTAAPSATVKNVFLSLATGAGTRTGAAAGAPLLDAGAHYHLSYL